MATLLLRLAGPLQAWGASSRFSVRSTRRAPTKSGVIGLIAAAQGRRRSDPIEDLLDLQIAVRVDQPGSLLRDFQTAVNAAGKAMPLSTRYYLEDAIFVVGIGGPKALLEGICESLQQPKFPLFLGRRSCPPSLPLILGLTDETLPEALSERIVPWQASAWFVKRFASRGYDAETLSDVPFDSEQCELQTQETVSDVPLAFDMEQRRYSWRTVYRSQMRMGVTSNCEDHDPMAVLEDV